MAIARPQRRVDGRRLLHQRRLSRAPSDRVPGCLLEFLQSERLPRCWSASGWKHLLPLCSHLRVYSHSDYPLHHFRWSSSLQLLHRAPVGLDRAQLALRALLFGAWSDQLDPNSGPCDCWIVSCPTCGQVPRPASGLCRHGLLLRDFQLSLLARDGFFWKSLFYFSHAYLYFRSRSAARSFCGILPLRKSRVHCRLLRSPCVHPLEPGFHFPVGRSLDLSTGSRLFFASCL